MIELQIGKKGLTPEFIEDIKKKFVNVENIRVSVLSSATREKAELIRIREEILKALGKKFTCRTIGYTLVFKKWRKARS